MTENTPSGRLLSDKEQIQFSHYQKNTYGDILIEEEHWDINGLLQAQDIKSTALDKAEYQAKLEKVSDMIELYEKRFFDSDYSILWNEKYGEVTLLQALKNYLSQVK